MMSDCALDHNNHYDVFKELKTLDHSDFLALGGELGISYSRLKDMNDLKHELVHSWLNQVDDVLDKSGVPTWGRLVTALELIGQVGIAHTIKTKHNMVNCDTPGQIIDVHKTEAAESVSDQIHTLSESEVTLCQKIRKEMKTLKRKFSLLQSQIRVKILDHRGLAACVLGMAVLNEDDDKSVREATSTNEIFIVLTKYWSFLDYEVLENIAMIMCERTEQNKMEEYAHDVERFCLYNVLEFPPDTLCDDIDTALKGMDKVEFRLNLSDPSVKDVISLKEVIANILEISTLNLVLVDIGRGSVLVTFLISTSLGRELFGRSLTEYQQHALGRSCVISITFMSNVINIMDTQLEDVSQCHQVTKVVEKNVYSSDEAAEKVAVDAEQEVLLSYARDLSLFMRQRMFHLSLIVIGVVIIVFGSSLVIFLERNKRPITISSLQVYIDFYNNIAPVTIKLILYLSFTFLIGTVVYYAITKLCKT